MTLAGSAELSPALRATGRGRNSLSCWCWGSIGSLSPGCSASAAAGSSQGSPVSTMPPTSWEGRLASVGDWLAAHQKTIRHTQWSVVGGYFILLAVPALLP